MDNEFNKMDKDKKMIKSVSSIFCINEDKKSMWTYLVESDGANLKRKELQMDRWNRWVAECNDGWIYFKGIGGQHRFFVLFKHQNGKCYKAFVEKNNYFRFEEQDEVVLENEKGTSKWKYVNSRSQSIEFKENLLFPKKSSLNLNLIPASSWWKNARSEISKSDWDQIRKQVYQKAGYTCEICGVKSQRLDCNELWDYKSNKQILVGLEAICRDCHLTQHMGYASTIGKQWEAFRHLLKINGWSESYGTKYVQSKFKEWEARSEIKWGLDLSYLTKNFGIKIGKEETKAERGEYWNLSENERKWIENYLNGGSSSSSKERVETGKRSESAKLAHERRRKEKYQKLAEEVIEKIGLKKDYQQWKGNQEKK